MKDLEESKFIESSNAYILLPISIEGPYKNTFTKYIFKRVPPVKRLIKNLQSRGILNKVGSIYRYSFRIGKKGYGIVFIVTGKSITAPIRPSYVERALNIFIVKYSELIVTSFSLNIDSFGLNKMPEKKRKEFFNNFKKMFLIDVKIH